MSDPQDLPGYVRSFATPQAVPRARSMRQAMSPSEAFLWSRLKGQKLAGFKFRRQQPLGPYFADFYCHDARLIVEVDGDQHARQRDHDQRRDEWLRKEGFEVFRFSARDLRVNPDGVMMTLRDRLRAITGTATGATPRQPPPSPHSR